MEAVLSFVGSWSWALTGPSGQKSFLSVLNSHLEWTYAENKIEKDGTGFKASPKYLNGEVSAEGRDQAQR